MKISNNRQARRYLRQVGSWLPCARRQRRAILEKIRLTLEGHLSAHPEATYQELTERFGTPQQIAAAYVEEMETGELLRDLRVRKKMVCIALGAAVVVIVLWLGVVALSYANHVDNVNGYYVEKVTEKDTFF